MEAGGEGGGGEKKMKRNSINHTYKGLLSCQNVGSSLIQGLDGCGVVKKQSYSIKVSECCIKFSKATETFIRVRDRHF